MQIFHLLFSRLPVFPVMVMCLTIVTPDLIYAADADYLQMLENEANSSSSVSSRALNDAVSESDMTELEKTLQSEKPSTYKYYNNLSKRDKTKIVNYYTADNSNQSERLSHIQKKILDFYFK